MILFKKKCYKFSDKNRILFESWMINFLETKGSFFVGNRFALPGMPSYRIISFGEDDVLKLYVCFSEPVKIKDKKGNTYSLIGNDGVFESFISTFDAEYINTLLEKFSSNTN